MSKGISVLVAAVFMMLITVVASLIVAGWISTMSSDRSNTLKNQTSTKLNCVYASLYIENATYQGNCDCSAGDHNLTVWIKNNGNVQISVDRIAIQNNTGELFTFNLNETKTLSVGTLLNLTNITKSGDAVYDCTGFNETSKIAKVVVSTMNCPDARDTLDGSSVLLQTC